MLQNLIRRGYSLLDTNPMPTQKRPAGWRRKVPYEVYKHNMVRSDPRAIAAWNAKVKRRNRRFAERKGLA